MPVFSHASFHFTSCSTAFESFNRGIFGPLVEFLYFLKYYMLKSEMDVSITRSSYGDIPFSWGYSLILVEKSQTSPFLTFWTILKTFRLYSKTTLPNRWLKALTERKINCANLTCASGYSLRFEKIMAFDVLPAFWKVILFFSKTNLLILRLLVH